MSDEKKDPREMTDEERQAMRFELLGIHPMADVVLDTVKSVLANVRANTQDTDPALVDEIIAKEMAFLIVLSIESGRAAIAKHSKLAAALEGLQGSLEQAFSKLAAVDTRPSLN